MNHHIEPQQNGASPFDTIKRISPETGAEYWSARDLMPLMAYAQWQNFMVPVNRAMTTAKNQGMDIETLFMRSHEKTAGRPREDFHLTRYAAYLVAMNGDPNIPEVAAAQHYFAVQTRVAETRPALHAAALPGRRELAQWVLEAEERIEELTAENTAYKGGDGIRIKDFIKTYFVAPNERAFFEWFYFHGLLIDGRLRDADGRASRSGKGPKLRWDHMHPTFIGRQFFKLVTNPEHANGRRLTRIIPERALDLVGLLLRAPDLNVQMTTEGRRAADEVLYVNPNQLRLISGE